MSPTCLHTIKDSFLNVSHSYCTLFSTHYLTRGLAMIRSLLKHSPASMIYVLCLDDGVEKNLLKYFPNSCIPIKLSEFESLELLELKSKRTHREYCWTCTPYIIKFCLEKYMLSECTYLDADLYFYSDPKPLHEELGNSSVSIISHRYTTGHDYSATSGKYCVQFMTFKNNAKGWEVLNWWKEACKEWCHEYFEDGKFGDQKYLDDWPTRFPQVKELQHLGGGMAPWNCQQYLVTRSPNVLILTEIATGASFPLVFYHFHGVSFYRYFVDISAYRISKSIQELLYSPYVSELNGISDTLSFNDLKAHPNNQKEFAFQDLKYLLYKLRKLRTGTMVNCK